MSYGWQDKGSHKSQSTDIEREKDAAKNAQGVITLVVFAGAIIALAVVITLARWITTAIGTLF